MDNVSERLLVLQGDGLVRLFDGSYSEVGRPVWGGAWDCRGARQEGPWVHACCCAGRFPSAGKAACAQVSQPLRAGVCAAAGNTVSDSHVRQCVVWRRWCAGMCAAHRITAGNTNATRCASAGTRTTRPKHGALSYTDCRTSRPFDRPPCSTWSSWTSGRQRPTWSDAPRQAATRGPAATATARRSRPPPAAAATAREPAAATAPREGKGKARGRARGKGGRQRRRGGVKAAKRAGRRPRRLRPRSRASWGTTSRRSTRCGAGVPGASSRTTRAVTQDLKPCPPASRLLATAVCLLHAHMHSPASFHRWPASPTPESLTLCLAMPDAHA